MNSHDVLVVLMLFVGVIVGVPVFIVALRIISGAADAILHSAVVAAALAVGVVGLALFARGSFPF